MLKKLLFLILFTFLLSQDYSLQFVNDAERQDKISFNHGFVNTVWQNATFSFRIHVSEDMLMNGGGTLFTKINTGQLGLSIYQKDDGLWYIGSGYNCGGNSTHIEALFYPSDQFEEYTLVKSSQLVLYKNGVQIANSWGCGDSNSDPDINTYIGPINAIIEEVSVWGNALNSSQINDYINDTNSHGPSYNILYDNLSQNGGTLDGPEPIYTGYCDDLLYFDCNNVFCGSSETDECGECYCPQSIIDEYGPGTCIDTNFDNIPDTCNGGFFDGIENCDLCANNGWENEFFPCGFWGYCQSLINPELDEDGQNGLDEYCSNFDVNETNDLNDCIDHPFCEYYYYPNQECYEVDDDIYGCTDPYALNYNSDATIDDGTCEYDENIYGCTYDNATNYNPDATVDDGSCEFLIGDINQDGNLNVLDVVTLVQSILNAIF